jgi:hypothetical protein
MKPTKNIKIVLLLLSSIINELYGQTYNHLLPNVVFPYQLNSGKLPENTYILISPLKLNSNPTDKNYISPKPIIIDHNGYVFWYMNSSSGSIGDFKYSSNDSLFYFTKYLNGIASYQLMDLKFNFVDSILNTNNVLSDAHEFQKLSNGNYIIGGMKDSIMDLSKLNYNGKPGSKTTNVRGYVIQEFNKQHKLVFEWNSNNNIHPKESFESYGYDSTKYDYAHGNSIEEDADGNLLISLRYLNSIYKINHQNGKIIWKLGGKSSSFSFTNDLGFSGQHDARRLTNDAISLFDNANTSKEPKTSRIIQYKLDTLNWTATKIWEYNQPFFVKSLGSYQVVNEDTHLINNGFSFRPNPSVVIINKLKENIATLTFKDSVMCYRSFCFEIPFQIKQPKILHANIGNKTILIAPDGVKNYLWSTGDTTQIIIADKRTTYQVWTNYGTGMLGSLPIDLNKITNDDFYLCNKNQKKISSPKYGETYFIKSPNGIETTIIWK